ARLAETEARAARELAENDARAARVLVEAKISESELEQGRAALLHGEPEAQRHLESRTANPHADVQLRGG
ncbi:MAG TPA: hypothetical protein VER33_20175, partial [Polyangiaceae bacterium]|nr:hypothetical protein [Polyangiaceae bacterium]